MNASKLILAITIASGLVLVGQEFSEFTAGMKSADRAWDRLRDLQSKTGKQAAHQAESIEGVYENMIAFWRQRDSAVAVKSAIEGKAAAAMLASAAYAGDEAQAQAAFKTLSGTCRSCHNAHREKLPDGKYRLTLNKK
jgi:cytochrome c556